MFVSTPHCLPTFRVLQLHAPQADQQGPQEEVIRQENERDEKIAVDLRRRVAICRKEEKEEEEETQS